MREKISHFFSKENWQISLFNAVLFIWVMSLPFKNAIYQISFILINLFFISHIIYYKNFALLREILASIKLLNIAFWGFFAAMIIANALNLDILGKKSWESAIFYIFRFGVIFVALLYFYKQKFFNKNFLIAAILGGLILLTMTAIIAILQNHKIIMDANIGLTGSLNSRTGFGFFMGLGLVASFALIKHKILMPILVLIFAFLMIFSFARSSWVAAAISIFIFLALNFKKMDAKHTIFIAILAIFVVLCYFSFDSFQARIADLMTAKSSGRFFIWRYCLEMISKAPFFGYGINTFRNLENSPANLNPTWNAAHNLELDALISVGIFGTIFLFTMIFGIFFKAYKSRDFSLLAIFAYIFVACQFDFDILNKEILSYILIFTFLLISQNFRSEKC